MCKLASIQTVNAVEPIPNADAIEKIRVLGWWSSSRRANISRETSSFTARSTRFYRSAPNWSSCGRAASSLLRPTPPASNFARRVQDQDGQAPRASVAGNLLPTLDLAT